MRDLNQVTLVGNLTRDPYIGEGKFGKYAFFTVATTDKVDDKEYTQFIECQATKNQALFAEKLTKGKRVMLFGKLKIRKNKDGVNETKVDVKELTEVPVVTTPNRSAEDMEMESYMS